MAADPGMDFTMTIHTDAFMICIWIWLNRICLVSSQTEEERQAAAQKRITIIVASTVSGTVFLLLLIICIGCMCYYRIVHKLRTQFFMRSLVDSKNRNEIIETPDDVTKIDDFFKLHEAEATRLFGTKITLDENANKSPDRRRERKKYGLEIDYMFSSERTKDKLKKKLKSPRKVQQLYKEKEMQDVRSNDSYLDGVIQESNSTESSEQQSEKEESGKDTSQNSTRSSCHNNEVNQRETIKSFIKYHAHRKMPDFLSLPEINQLFIGPISEQKEKKKKLRSRTQRGRVKPLNLKGDQTNDFKHRIRPTKPKKSRCNEVIITKMFSSETDTNVPTKIVKTFKTLDEGTVIIKSPVCCIESQSTSLPKSISSHRSTSRTRKDSFKPVGDNVNNKSKKSKAQIAKEYDMARRSCTPMQVKFTVKKTAARKSKTQLSKEYDADRRLKLEKSNSNLSFNGVYGHNSSTSPFSVSSRKSSARCKSRTSMVSVSDVGLYINSVPNGTR